MAHEAKALAFVDAVHFAPHQLVDVQAWGCDFMVCSAYKFHGPHVGVLFGKRELLRLLEVTKLRPAPDTVPSGSRRELRTMRESSAPRPPSSFWQDWSRKSKKVMPRRNRTPGS